MATEIDSSAEFGITIPFEVKDNATPSIKALVEHISRIYNTFKAAGRSSDEATRAVNNFAVALKNLFSGTSQYKKATDNLDEALKKVREIQEKGKDVVEKAAGYGQKSDVDRFLKNATQAFIAFKAAVMPGQALRKFADECTNINFKLSTLAMTAGMSVARLSQLGNAYRVFGGTAADAARGEKSYELEMERRRRGQGDGGVYAEAMRRYGIVFNPNERYQDWFKKVIKWSESLGNGRAADAARINMKAIAGLSDAEFRIMKGGMAAYEREQAMMAPYAPVAQEASEAAAELKKSTEHLTVAWENLKNKALIALKPILSDFYVWTKGIVDKFSAIPKEFWTIGVSIAGAIAGLVAFVSALKAVQFGAKALYDLKNVGKLDWWLGRGVFGNAGKAAQTVASAGSGVASAAGSVAGGLFSGLSKGLSGLMKISGLGSITESTLLLSVEHCLLDILSLLNGWFKIWLGISTKGVLGKYRTLDMISAGMLDLGWKSDPFVDNKEKLFWAKALQTAANNEYNVQKSAYEFYNKDESTSNGSVRVNVDKIEISIDGAGKDVNGIAEAVHEKIIEEFQILAEQDNTREIR